MDVALNYQSIKVIFPDKVRTMKELNADLDSPLTADEMVLKAINCKAESTADYSVEVTGRSGSAVTKSVAKLETGKLITKELRPSKPGQSGNGKRAYFMVVVQC